ncbi:MAG: hypothetical protein V4760_05820 [Bdellovibrionota bacterium]
MTNEKQRQQELKKSTNVTGPAETSEADTKFGSDGNDLDVSGIEQSLSRAIGTQDVNGENIGGQEAGGIAGSGGVSTTDVGQRGPGKSIGH